MFESLSSKVLCQVMFTLVHWQFSLLNLKLFLMGHSRPLFVYFSSFQAILQGKNVEFNRVQTRIVGEEGETADHLSTKRPGLALGLRPDLNQKCSPELN